MTERTIEVIRGGPLRVVGVPLARLERREDHWALGATLACDAYLLCRCGASENMPLCDAAPPYRCFEEEPVTARPPGPFRWDMPEPGDPAVALKPGGPARIAGTTPITEVSGAVVDPGRRVSLCRCGASRCQPLCDGSHKIVPVPDP